MSLRKTRELENKWDDGAAAAMSGPELLQYRSNLLGSDLRITNFGGGNTSAKVDLTDPLTGKKETVLWVKGSGGDLGSMGLDETQRRQVAARLMPVLRGKITGDQSKAGHFNDTPEILQFKDKATARIAGEFYINAINVMREANGVDEYVGLDEQEAFDIEYWLLEDAKLQRMPKPKSMAGKVAFITGGAGGIGRATAGRLLQQGACVVLADIDQDSLDSVVADLSDSFGSDVIRGVHCDVTKEESVAAAIGFCSVEFGGLDIVVSNAGIASSAPLDQASLEMWDRNMGILATGYFLVSREAFKILKAQGTGGSIVMEPCMPSAIAGLDDYRAMWHEQIGGLA